MRKKKTLDEYEQESSLLINTKGFSSHVPFMRSVKPVHAIGPL